VFEELERDTYLREMSRDQAVTRMAVHLGAVNELHPFREGNGRIQHAFFGQLAHQAGWRIAWERLNPADNVAAGQDAHHNPDAPTMAALLDQLVEPARPALRALAGQSPPWPAPHREPPGHSKQTVATGDPRTKSSTKPPSADSAGRPRCAGCGRPLTSATSIARGYGPNCAPEGNG